MHLYVLCADCRTGRTHAVRLHSATMAKEKQINVLLIEDSPTDTLLIHELLRNAPHEYFHIITAPTLALGLETLSHGGVDVILLDLGLPDSEGLDTFRSVRERASPLPIVVLTVSDDEELGREAVQKGAQRFLIKDALRKGDSYAGIFTLDAVRYAIEQKGAEVAFQANEEQFKTLFNDSPVAQGTLRRRWTPR